MFSLVNSNDFVGGKHENIFQAQKKVLSWLSNDLFMSLFLFIVGYLRAGPRPPLNLEQFLIHRKNKIGCFRCPADTKLRGFCSKTLISGLRPYQAQYKQGGKVIGFQSNFVSALSSKKLPKQDAETKRKNSAIRRLLTEK